MSDAFRHGPMYVPLAAMVPLAAAIKEVVDIPVLAVCRINDPVLAEKILADGHADLVGMTRACIADPQMPNKAKAGQLEDIPFLRGHKRLSRENNTWATHGLRPQCGHR